MMVHQGATYTLVLRANSVHQGATYTPVLRVNSVHQGATFFLCCQLILQDILYQLLALLIF